MKTMKPEMDQISKEAEEILAEDVRELLNEELEEINGGCSCYNNSKCMSYT